MNKLLSIIIILIVSCGLVSGTTVVLEPNYDGYVTSSARSDTVNYVAVGVSIAIISRAFFEFNTSLISNGANITNVTLNLTVTALSEFDKNMSISRFGTAKIKDNSTFGTNATGNLYLYSNISDGYNKLGFYVRNTSIYENLGVQSINLGTTANSDLQANLANDFFGIGIKGNAAVYPGVDYTIFNSSESTSVVSRPKLIVTYYSCNPPSSGDWIVNETCDNFNNVYQCKGNLIIGQSGDLRLNNSIINFTTSGKYIQVFSGGKLQIRNSKIGGIR